MKLFELFFLNLFLLLSVKDLDWKDLDSNKSKIVSSAKAPIGKGYSAKSAKGGMVEMPEPPPDMLMNPMRLPPLPPMVSPPINPPPVTNANP